MANPHALHRIQVVTAEGEPADGSVPMSELGPSGSPDVESPAPQEQEPADEPLPPPEPGRLRLLSTSMNNGFAPETVHVQ
jgi:hypothetical protein